MTARKVACILLLLASTVTGCNTQKSVSVPVPEPVYWPTEEWQNSTPEAQGIGSNLLAQMLEEISTDKTGIHSVLVIRNGYLVTEAYFHPYTHATPKVQVQSITKSVIGALVGIAVQDGFIKDVNEKLLDFFPKRSIANPSHNKSALRLKHLLSMSSGFPCQEFSRSGQGMEQSSAGCNICSISRWIQRPGRPLDIVTGILICLSAILGIRTGMDAREFANQELFRALGIPPVENRTGGQIRRASQTVDLAFRPAG